MLKDRRHRPVVTHRISCGRVSGKGTATRITKLDYFEITTFERSGDNGPYVVDVSAMDRLRDFGPRYVHKQDADNEKGHVVASRRIPIRVDSDDLGDFLTQRYESTVLLPVIGAHGERLMDGAKAVTRPGVWCSGDGDRAERLARDLKTKNSIRCCASPTDYEPRSSKEMGDICTDRKEYVIEDGKRCPYAQNTDPEFGPTCKPVTTLICRSDVVANIGAFCRYRSHAHSSADFIFESLTEIKRQMPGGLLRNVPLDLVLEMKLLGRPGGKTALQPVAHVELRLTPEDTVRLIETNLRQDMRALGAVEESRRLLAAARDDVKAEVIDGEFGSSTSTIEKEQRPSGGIDILVKP